MRLERKRVMKKRVCVLLIIMMLLSAAALADGTAYAGEFNTQAFSEAYAEGKLRLKKLNLPGMEGITWISVSPNGKLFGCSSDGYVIYDAETDTATVQNIDWTGDEFGHLERVLSLYWNRCGEVVWSPDGRYYALVNRTEVMLRINLRWDLFVGDTQTNTIRVLKTWSDKPSDVSSGAVYQLCFDDEGEKIYYSFIGDAQNPFEPFFSREGIMTAEYDMATGSIRPLFNNGWRDENGKEYLCTGSDLYYLSGGRLLQAYSSSDGSEFGLRLMIPEGDEWISEYYAIQAPESGYMRLQLRMVSDDYCVLMWTDRQTAKGVAKYIGIGEDNRFTEHEEHEAENVQISPDGNYCIFLIENKQRYDDEYDLDVHAKAGRELPGRSVVRIDTPFFIKSNRYYLAGENDFSVRFNNGIEWGGNLLLLGIDQDVEVYQFEGVE